MNNHCADGAHRCDIPVDRTSESSPTERTGRESLTDSVDRDIPSHLRDARQTHSENDTGRSFAWTRPSGENAHHLSPRHRLILSRLLHHDGVLSVVALACDVAAYISDQPPESLSSEVVRQAFVDLQPSLTWLASQGYIDYCEAVGTVELRMRTHESTAAT